MRLYRIVRARDARDLSGEGARIAGGRWNSAGVPVLYTAETASLAALEALVHAPPRLAPADLMLVTLELPSASSLESLDRGQLPADWHQFPAPRRLAALGDAWANEGKSVGFRVPSAILPIGEEKNVLLNPRHQHYSRLTVVAVTPFRFDLRLDGRPPT